ncbi:MAG TPA: peptidylprolyl isomerase [Blastocatellia bacterium]|jgi:cyclophilin family peptidyl-prolyl cis-trans isomerase|nr:peptidylprolyl isomerase [Blastocatellia bacterium]
MITRWPLAAPARLGRSAGLSLILFSLLWAGACNTASEPAANSNQSRPAPSNNPIAVIETTAGNIKVELLQDQAPKTAENFRMLADSGFYNNLKFHRIVSGFMIQGGDPNGDGTGGRTATGAALPNEISRSSPLYAGGYKRGAVAMANKGRPETASSQFFIMHQNYPLPPNYTIFGRVVEGMDVVDKIATAPLAGPERPQAPVVMKNVYIQK